MLPYLFQLGSFRISTFGFFVAISFMIASFVLWKYFREDYPEEEILTFTIYLFLTSLIGARIFYIAENFPVFGLYFDKWLFWSKYPGFSFIGAFLGGGFFLNYWVKKKKWDLWLLADKTVIIFFLVQMIGGIGLVLSTVNRFDFIRLLIVTGLFFLSYYLLGHYRKFVWYKSGKIGFVACFGLALYFLFFGLLEFFKRNGIYWDIFIFPVFSIISFLFLYRRSK